MCDQVQGLTNPDLEIFAQDSHMWHSCQIGPFQCPTLKLFEAKLDQFPQGTVFSLAHSDSGHPGSQRRIEAAIPGILEKHGMKLASPIKQR